MAALLAELGEVDLVAFDDGSAAPDALADIGVETHLVPYEPTPARVAAGLRHMRSLSGARFWDARIARSIRELSATRRYDLVQVEYSVLAPHVALARGATTVLDLHNVESRLIRSSASIRRAALRPAVFAEAHALARLERWALRRFDVKVFVSEKEVGHLPPAPGTLVCPNGWDVPPAPPPAGDPKVAIFIGLLGWAPNTDAARWLLEAVWPRVRAQVADARLLVVGREPPPELAALAPPGAEVVASPPDVAPYLARAAVALAPLRVGGGSRLKILEALAAARPVVATSIGAEGLETLIGRGVTVADDADALAAAIVERFKDPAAARREGEAGHAAVDAEFSWRTTLTPLRETLAAAAATRPSNE
jgi:glycosyltransferase involved in cell wall biosynthesis